MGKGPGRGRAPARARRRGLHAYARSRQPARQARAAAARRRRVGALSHRTSAGGRCREDQARAPSRPPAPGDPELIKPPANPSPSRGGVGVGALVAFSVVSLILGGCASPARPTNAPAIAARTGSEEAALAKRVKTYDDPRLADYL